MAGGRGRRYAGCAVVAVTLAGCAPAWAQGGETTPAEACRALVLLEPARLSTIGEARPTLRWRAQASGSYRVQVAVLVPESRIVATHDVQVKDAHWTLPAPLAVDHAAVKVLVSQGCPQLDAQDLHALGAWFFIDLRGDCAVDPAGLRAQDGRLDWQAVPAAQSYRVRLLRPPLAAEGAFSLVHEAQAHSPSWALPAQRRPGDVAVVQAVCATRSGHPAAWPLS